MLLFEIAPGRKLATPKLYADLPALLLCMLDTLHIYTCSHMHETVHLLGAFISLSEYVRGCRGDHAYMKHVGTVANLVSQ